MIPYSSVWEVNTSKRHFMSSWILKRQFFPWDGSGRKYHNVDLEGGGKFPLKGRFVWYRDLIILSELEVFLKNARKKNEIKDIEPNILKDKANGKSEDEQETRVRILSLSRDAFV